jgi:hypothetical protein
MKKTFVVCALVMALWVPGSAWAKQHKAAHPHHPAVHQATAAAAVTDRTTIADVSLTTLIENNALPTPWGNVYFNNRDMHKIVHGAAHLRGVDLGTFTTDQNAHVKLVATKFHAGTVTFDAAHL